LLLGDVVGTGRPESFNADLRELQVKLQSFCKKEVGQTGPFEFS
jgi:hypothetical protein